jgi:hypothetical protein
MNNRAAPIRRFPAPWTVEDAGTGSVFAVKDASGQKLGYFYGEEPGRRSSAKLLTKVGARRIATNVAKAAGVVAEVLKYQPMHHARLATAL